MTVYKLKIGLHYSISLFKHFMPTTHEQLMVNCIYFQVHAGNCVDELLVISNLLYLL